MRLLRLRWAALAMLVVTTGCEEEMRAPPVPVSDGSTRDAVIMPPPPPPPADGGMDTATVDASDAATDASEDADAGLPLGCVVAGAGTGTDATLIADGAPFPFAVTRAFAAWDESFCTVPPPTILVGLTEGSCIPTVDDQLIFAINADEIGASITVGANMLFVEPDDVGLTVRFRAVGAGGTVEEWGTCEGSSGTVTFSELGGLAGDSLTATYDMLLTDCTSPFDSPAITVTGSFDLRLEVSFESACL